MLGGFAALFAVFGIRTALRHCMFIEVTEAALQSSGLLQASISWSKLDRMKLSYYSTRRDGRGGGMQLKLGAGRVNPRGGNPGDGVFGCGIHSATGAGI